MSNAGSTIDRLAPAPVVAALERGEGNGVEPLVEAVQHEDRLGRDAEVRRDRAGDGRVVGIERGVLAGEPRDGLHHARRAPGRVLVQVQPQPFAGIRQAFVFEAHDNRRRTECACAVSPSASARVMAVGATCSSPRRVRRWTERTRTKSAALARRGTARRRWSAARGSTRWRSRLPPARSRARRTWRPRTPPRRRPARRRTRGAPARCGRAIAMASARCRVSTMPPLRASAARAGPSSGACASTSRCTCWANRLLQVSRIARASGSCSACAIEIRGDPGGIAAAGDDDDLARAGVEVDGAVGGHQRLRRRHVRVAGPDDLVHARDRRGAVGQRRHRVRAADAEQARHARLGRGRERRRARACGQTATMISARRPPARGWRSSAAKTAAGTGRPGRSSRRARAASPAVRRPRPEPPSRGCPSAPGARDDPDVARRGTQWRAGRRGGVAFTPAAISLARHFHGRRPGRRTGARRRSDGAIAPLADVAR